MKTHYTILFALLALLACTHTASAITISVNEDSATRFDYTIIWGADFNGDYNVQYLTPGASDQVRIREISNAGMALTAFGTIWPQLGTGSADFFDILFNSPTELAFGQANIVFSSATQILALNESLYGARFVYGAPLSPVPDSANTLALLAGVVGILGLYKHYGTRGAWAFFRRNTHPCRVGVPLHLAPESAM